MEETKQHIIKVVPENQAQVMVHLCQWYKRDAKTQKWIDILQFELRELSCKMSIHFWVFAKNMPLALL